MNWLTCDTVLRHCTMYSFAIRGRVIVHWEQCVRFRFFFSHFYKCILLILLQFYFSCSFSDCFQHCFSVLGMFYYVSFSGPKIFSIPDFVLFPGIFTLCLDCFSIMTWCEWNVTFVRNKCSWNANFIFKCQNPCFVSKVLFCVKSHTCLIIFCTNLFTGKGLWVTPFLLCLYCMKYMILSFSFIFWNIFLNKSIVS